MACLRFGFHVALIGPGYGSQGAKLKASSNVQALRAGSRSLQIQQSQRVRVPDILRALVPKTIKGVWFLEPGSLNIGYLALWDWARCKRASRKSCEERSLPREV